MRVLFISRLDVGSRAHGLRIQIDQTAAGLRALGHEVLYFDPWSDQIEQVDVVHIVGAESYALPLAQRARNWGAALVVSPMLTLATAPWFYILVARLACRLPGFLMPMRHSRRLLHMADEIIFLTEHRRRILCRAYQVPRHKTHVVPNGIDRRFAEGTPELFESAFGLRDFVLNVGYVTEVKNQLNLIRAMRSLPHPLVIVGAPEGLPSAYLDACKAEAGRNVHFVGAMPYGDPRLVSAYAAARVFALPSVREAQPLALIEAALAGCRLVTSDTVPVQGFLREHVVTAPWDDPERLRQAIEAQYRAPRDDSLRRLMLEQPDWTEVARRIEAVYRRAVDAHQDKAPAVAGGAAGKEHR